MSSTIPAGKYITQTVTLVNGSAVYPQYSSPLTKTDDVFVYDTAGFSQGVVPTTTQSAATGQGSNLLVTSGDATRVISATNADYGTQTLMFRSLP